MRAETPMKWGESQHSGKGIPEEGTASAKVLRLALLVTLEEDAEGPPGRSGRR